MYGNYLTIYEFLSDLKLSVELNAHKISLKLICKIIIDVRIVIKRRITVIPNKA